MFGSGAADGFSRAVTQKTGLYQQGDKFVGTFQGLPAWTQTQMVADVAGSFHGHGGALGGLGALLGGSAGGMAQAMTGGGFFMKHDYVIELPTSNLPAASLRESTSFLNDKSYQQRPAMGPRASSGVQWIDSKYEVCAVDPNFIRYVCASPELQQCLPRWHFLNLSWQGTHVWLELLDSTTRIAGKFGGTAMQNGDMTLAGLWLAAAAARATFAR